MSIGLPNINITFSKLAATAVTRSERGIVCMVVKDDTQSSETVKTYDYLSDVTKSDYTAENYRAINDCFKATPNKVIVVKIATSKEFNDAVKRIDFLTFNWLCFIDSDQSDVTTYTKSRNSKCKSRKIKAVVWNDTAPDDRHIVNFVNTKVTRAGESEESGYLYLGRIAGVLAAMPFTRSCTNYSLADLESVTEPANVESSIGDGGLVIINNYGEPVIARGVNSLKTLSGTVSTEFQKITIVEAMDMVLEDIYSTFKESYLGKYKNKLDYQMLFIAAVNGYFRNLVKEDILDNEFDNKAEIDIEEQRNAWIAEGKTEATDWDEATVKSRTYGSKVFLKGNIKILDAMEDLEFPITLE